MRIESDIKIRLLRRAVEAEAQHLGISEGCQPGKGSSSSVGPRITWTGVPIISAAT